MKRCFVLGAGASIGHSKGLFPTISSFFSKLFDDKALYRIPALRHIAHNGFKYLDTYIENRFGFSIGEDEIDIEKILTGIEIDIERHPEDTDYQMVRYELIEYIITLLVRSQEATNKNTGQYNFLFEILTREDTIMTFNWDCLFDDLIGRLDVTSITRKSITTAQYANFYEQLTCPSEFTTERFSNPPPIDRPKYKAMPPGTINGIKIAESKEGYFLKMHGSIDWFYCNNSSCKTYPHIWPIKDPLALKSCGHCYEDLSRLIIPPILNKGIREHPTIRRIWSLARIELMQAKEVIIWSYSLPPTDFYSNWLLRQARTERLKKIVLINPALFNNDGSEELEKRLKEPFKGIVGEEHIEKYPDFEEYYNALQKQ